MIINSDYLLIFPQVVGPRGPAGPMVGILLEFLEFSGLASVVVLQRVKVDLISFSPLTNRDRQENRDHGEREEIRARRFRSFTVTVFLFCSNNMRISITLVF